MIHGVPEVIDSVEGASAPIYAKREVAVRLRPSRPTASVRNIRWPVWLLVVLAIAGLGATGLVVSEAMGTTHGQTSESGLESAGVKAYLSHFAGEAQGTPVRERARFLGNRGPAAASGPLISSLSSATTRTYHTVRGTMLTDKYAGPVNFLDGENQWRPIDNGLVQSGAGWRNKANIFLLSLPRSLAQPVSVSSGSTSVSFSLRGAHGEGAVSGSAVRYAHALPAADVTYRSVASGVDEAITLTGTRAPRSLRFDMSTSRGLRVQRAADGSIRLVDRWGRVRFSIAPSIAYTQRGATRGASRSVPSSLVRSGAGWLLSLNLSERWLRSELAQGPVLVDPSISYGINEGGADLEGPKEFCTLKEASPTKSDCNPNTNFSVGGKGPSLERALLATGVVPSNAIIIDGFLNMSLEHQTTKTAVTLEIHRVTQAWTSSATWNTYDGSHSWTKAGGDYAEGGDTAIEEDVGGESGGKERLGPYIFNVTELLQEWANESAGGAQGYPNDGLLVSLAPSSEGQNTLEFYGHNGAEHGGEAPVLESEWVSAGTGEKPQYTMLPMQLTTRASIAVNAGNGNLFAQSNDLSIAGRGLSFNGSRVYNSLSGAWKNEFGNWQDSNQPGLRFERNDNQGKTEEQPNVILYRDGTGAWYQFFRNGKNYITPSGIKATLCWWNSESPCKFLAGEKYYRLTYDQSKIHIDFNRYGAPIDVEDQYGNTLSSNGGNYPPTTWTDTEGRQITYTKTKSGEGEAEQESPYASMTDVSGSRTIRYGYTTGKELEGSGLLETVTDANSGTTHYQYKGEGGSLSKITTPRGEVINIVYVKDSSKVSTITRTTNAEHTTGPTWTFTYYEAGKAPAPCTASQKATVVKDPDGTDGKAGHVTTYCSNPLNQIEKTIDANGDETQTAYDSFGNVSATTAGSPGNGESGGVESFHYDEAGQNLLCVVAGTSRKNPLARPHRMNRRS